MSKKGVSKITGNSAPKTGVTTLYKVAEWYPATPAASRNEALVTWELFKKRADGKFTTTNIKKKGRGEFTFGSKAHLYTYKVEGYLHSPEGVSPMSMVITPQKNDKQPTAEKNILGIKLTYRDGSAVTKTLSYRDQLRATAKCQNLEGKTLVFTLWEDDENGAGHHVKNQKILQSPPILVDRKGYARWDFTLLTTFIALANKREDDKKQHEYYVTAEYNGKMNASGNVNANNPQFKKPPTAVQPKLKPTPNAPKTSTNPASKHNQPDKKGIIRSIKLADKDGNAFTKKPKFGDTISVIIDARNVTGLSYTLRLWEHDNIGDHDLLYNNTHIFKNDLQRALITLTGKMQKIGETGNNPKKPDSGEYLTGNYQEIFAEVIFEKVSAKSAVIDVGIMEEPKKEVSGKSPAIKKNDESPRKTESCVCKDEYKLIWGNKISCSERKKVVEVCKNIWGESKKIEKAKELMSIMHLETAGSFSPSQKGVSKKGTKYIGLIQFSETTAKSLGTSYDALGKMTFIGQMDYVEKYLNKNKDKMKTLVDFYLQVLNPAAVGKGSDPTYKVFDESITVPDGDGSKTSAEQREINITKDPWVKKYGYASNPPFMKGDERTKRKKWVYTRQRYEDRYGYENGNTTIKEIDDVVRLEHYNPGQAELYVDKCEDKPVGKKDDQGKRAPWVDVAFSEFEKFKGKREKDSPLKERISQYFKGTGNSDLNYKSAWCAAFVRWCFDQTEEYKDTNTKGTAAAFDWAEFGNSKVVSNKYVDGWSNGSRSEPFVGAVIVFSWSHVAFIVGENKDKSKYVYIGGNQTGWEGKIAGTQVISMSSISKKSSDIFAIMKPKDYVIDDAEKQLPTYNVESENDFNSTR